MQEWRSIGPSEWLCKDIRFGFRVYRACPELNPFYRRPYTMDPELKQWVMGELDR